MDETENANKTCQGIITKSNPKGIYCLLDGDNTANANIEYFIPCSNWCNMLERKFRKGDKVKLICRLNNLVSHKYFLCEEYVKPLLIFDMNGVLGDREPFRPKQKRRFFKRPHLEEFLEYCTQHFEIAVWSSCLEKNIDISIFGKFVDRLMFVWSSKQCTIVPNRTSHQSVDKPLFHKELRKVWTEFPSYSPRNTLLLDNDLEKCEANPVGSCIIIPNFELTERCIEEDFLLRVKDGALVSLLNQILKGSKYAERSPLDTTTGYALLNMQHYISENVVGRHPMCPNSYKTVDNDLDICRDSTCRVNDEIDTSKKFNDNEIDDFDTIVDKMMRVREDEQEGDVKYCPVAPSFIPTFDSDCSDTASEEADSCTFTSLSSIAVQFLIYKYRFDEPTSSLSHQDRHSSRVAYLLGKQLHNSLNTQENLIPVTNVYFQENQLSMSLDSIDGDMRDSIVVECRYDKYSHKWQVENILRSVLEPFTLMQTMSLLNGSEHNCNQLQIVEKISFDNQYPTYVIPLTIRSSDLIVYSRRLQSFQNNATNEIYTVLIPCQGYLLFNCVLFPLCNVWVTTDHFSEIMSVVTKSTDIVVHCRFHNVSRCWIVENVDWNVNTNTTNFIDVAWNVFENMSSS